MTVPKDDDEWLLFESSRLTQFTRLYPPLKPSVTTVDTNGAASAAGAQQAAAAAAEALDVEVQGEDEVRCDRSCSSTAAHRYLLFHDKHMATRG
jgi:hypothetical protein